MIENDSLKFRFGVVYFLFLTFDRAGFNFRSIAGAACVVAPTPFLFGFNVRLTSGGGGIEMLSESKTNTLLSRGAAFP